MSRKLNDIYQSYQSANKEIDEADNKKEELGIHLPINTANVVSGDKLRAIQSRTLNDTRDFLAKTFGPMGSNTKIIKGQNNAEITSSYSKDGLKVLSNIINSGPIESSIVDELISVTRAVEKEVGDGTTSTVILSSLIFDKLIKMANNASIPPFKLCRLFDSVVDEIKESILSKKKDCTLDDIYNIALISTNGNEAVANNIKYVYEKYGFDVDINIGISNDADTKINVYDGLTIGEGMADPAFINNASNNSCEIRNASIYHFVDPIDTVEMVNLFEAILENNIYGPIEAGEAPIPTVITCPRLSSDMSGIMKQLVNQLYQFNGSGAENMKPPILIITNVIASDEIIMDDIANLCGCKSIKKYIDRNIYNKEVEKGLAATVDNVASFAGHAELVSANTSKTKFINPQYLVDKTSKAYTTLINFLTTEIENVKSSEDAHTVGLLKRRLSAIKSNLVDYLVGGVTIAERDMNKDLVEDAIKNCRSASLYGIGYAANYMGLKSAFEIVQKYLDEEESGDDFDYKTEIAHIILMAYIDCAKILYSTVEGDEEKVMRYIWASVANGSPFNISSGSLPDDINDNDDTVLCSIMLDVNILNTISKIITMMVTCNQCLLQASHLNIY